MTNRDRILQTSEYDLLCRMNARLLERKDFSPCIMSAFGSKYRMIRCMKFKADCAECIREFLNEEEGAENE